MSGDLGNLVVSLSADIARFTEDMGKASKVANETAAKMALSFESVNSAIGAIGKGLAGTLALAGGGALFGSMVKESQDWALSINSLSKSLGTTVEEASAFKSMLGHVGVDQETFTNSLLKLEKAAAATPEKFDALGISIRDSNGDLLSARDLWLNFTKGMKEFEEGASRNAAASVVLGKGVRDLNDILKANSEGLTAGQQRVKDLGIVVTQEGVGSAREYKESMNDLNEVMKTFKIQIGNEIIPELTNLSVAFTKTGKDGMGTFQSYVHDVRIKTRELIVDFQELELAVLKRSPAPLLIAATGGGAGGDFIRKLEIATASQKMAIDKLKNPQDYVNPMAHDFDMKGTKKFNPDDVKNNLAENWNAAHMKELAYLKAFEEKKAAILISAANLETEINKNSYDLGLKDLKSYLENKHTQSLVAIDAEIAAKRQELANAQALSTSPVTDKTGAVNASKTAAAQYEGMLKVEQAEKALIDLEGKRAILLKQNSQETIVMTDAQLRGYKSISVELLKMTGQMEAAQKVQDEIDKASVNWKLTQTEAAAGNLDARKALYEMNQKMAVTDLQAALTDSAALAGLTGDWEKYYKQQNDLLDIQIKLAEESGRPTAFYKAQKADVLDVNDLTKDLLIGFDTVGRGWRETAKQMKTVGEELANALQKGMSDIFFDGMQGKFKTLGEYINGFLANVERAVSDAISKQLVGNLTGALKGIGGGVSVDSPFFDLINGSDTVPSAKGNVFSSAGLDSYKNTVVSKPTFFPFASGVGLMGEAGPEAIMPLKRAADGSLGIRAGGQGFNQTVNIINKTDAKVTAQTSQDGMSMEVLIEQVESSMSKRMSRGYGLAPMLDARYGRKM